MQDCHSKDIYKLIKLIFAMTSLVFMLTRKMNEQTTKSSIIEFLSKQAILCGDWRILVIDANPRIPGTLPVMIVGVLVLRAMTNLLRLNKKTKMLSELPIFTVRLSQMKVQLRLCNIWRACLVLSVLWLKSKACTCSLKRCNYGIMSSTPR